MTSCFASSFSGVRGYSQPAANMDYPRTLFLRGRFNFSIKLRRGAPVNEALAGRADPRYRTRRWWGASGGSQLSPSGVRSQAVLAQGQRGSVGPSPSRGGRWRPQGDCSGCGGARGARGPRGLPSGAPGSDQGGSASWDGRAVAGSGSGALLCWGGWVWPCWSEPLPPPCPTEVSLSNVNE